MYAVEPVDVDIITPSPLKFWTWWSFIPKDGSHSVAIIEIMPIEGNHHEVDMDINLIDINTGEIIEL